MLVKWVPGGKLDHNHDDDTTTSNPTSDNDDKIIDNCNDTATDRH